MKVSPLDLRQVRFKTTFRGFEPAEVLALITEVADDYEHALREVDRMRQEVAKMEALPKSIAATSATGNMMVTAQKISDEMCANADAQARQIVRRLSRSSVPARRRRG
jgi:cell division initiation protein